ncbi:piggyBac transposable element-derived protein 4-like [Ptychodera flava]|uniref:piggyBac transposable element-derived protein 4-like n=1 Tax=Ptychodera flava TaxID=63121 RepID=UPI003969DC35
MADANQTTGCDLRQYANTLALLNPEDREFFAQHFLDSDSDDDGDFLGFEDVNFIPIERIANPDDDADFPEDVANNWSRNPIDDVVQLTMPYDYSMVGMKVPVPADASPLDFIRLFLTDEVLEIIVRETNLYAEQVIAEKRRRGLLSPFSRMQRWYNVNKDELSVFLGLTITMGLVDKGDLGDYWSTSEVLRTPFFPNCMSRNRYEIILQFLHFNDNEAMPVDRSSEDFDPLYKIRPVYDIITRRFQEVYHPNKCLSLDEAMVPWRGNLAMRVYVPSKPDRFGMKAFTVNEAKTGYTIAYNLYTGRNFNPYPDAEESELDEGMTYKIVMGLLTSSKLLDMGHSVYMDNYYMSPTLVDALSSRDTVAVGTVRLNRKEMPKALQKTKLKRGGTIWRRHGELLALKWHDKRDVTILSNAHTAEWGFDGKSTDGDGNPVLKPTSVLEYNKYMGGTDLSDQMCKYYPLLRRRNKWYIKLFFSLLGLLITNAFILWRKFSPDEDQRKMSHAKFRLEAVEQLVGSASNAPTPVQDPRARRSVGMSIRRLTERHFPSKIKPKEGAMKTNPCRECLCCKDRLKGDQQYQLTFGRQHHGRVRYPTSRYECRQCGVALCIDGCFEVYHTFKHYANIDPVSLQAN